MTGSASVPCPNSESRMPSTENLPMKKLISKCKSQWSRSVFAITLVSLATLFFALSNPNAQTAAAPAALTPVLLHFNGNPPEDSGCTGNGSVDVLVDTCANL